MKFLLYVDPALALRAGNENIHEQYVDVDLAELTDHEREVVSQSYILPKQAVIDLTRFPNEARVPDVLNCPIAKADREAVLHLIHTRLDAQKERQRLKAFAEDYFEAGVGPLIDRHKPSISHVYLGGATTEYKLISTWLSQHYPEDAEITLNRDEKYDGLTAKVKQCLSTRIGRCDSFNYTMVDGSMTVDHTDLPDDKAGIAYLESIAGTMMQDEKRRAWISQRFDARRKVLEQQLNEELESKRESIDEIIKKRRKEIAQANADAALIEQTIQQADTKNPQAHIKERWKGGVLPQDEFLALLREVAFTSLSGISRFKRIADTEVKRRRSQDVTYKTEECKAVKAKNFQLAKDIKTKLSNATVEHVNHVAYVDGEPVLARDAVRATIAFAGIQLSREYVPD